ncbi:hypothetical protein BJ123_11146 [Rhodopseudomonas thermotolerans]|uniref:Uncharacterized protein n=2 Tax=Rhodopseudomonas TaxID=1073 RepID=A0A336JNG9_9BRAD|nr:MULTISPECIES: hypothetical protein [Rhodopseudomonas]RED33209.1 hypothetical protein BJ125_11146 [Rhodopseudomonas pentothenatexigens]REF93958.1 hypothetical protein BJ123_11146 [Rhodopseudomonas thermotolerans]SSW91285.1 hypothetical protein SAMN05892882_11146 [Rhodopseudomonas pentothenatexigens]
MPRRLSGRANTTRPCSIADYTGKTLAAARRAVSGAEASPNAVPNPFKPSIAPSYFTFQPDTVTSNLHAGDGRNILVEARSGDVLNLAIGAVAQVCNSTTGNTDICYQGGMPVRGRAGRDIVNFGRVGYSDQYNKVFPGLIVGADPTDVSIVAAGRNILYLNVQIAGPGSLDVSAGGTVYQGNLGAITSSARSPPATRGPAPRSSSPRGSGATGRTTRRFISISTPPISPPSASRSPIIPARSLGPTRPN